MTAVLKVIAGSVGAPGLAFSTDATSGFYLPGASNPAVAAGGVQAQNWTNTSSVSPIAVTQSGQINPTILAADQNNYAPTGIETSSTLYLTSSLTVNITGIAGAAAGTAPVAGRQLRVLNANALGSGFNIVLKNNVTSTAANRFSMGGDLTLYPQQEVQLQYNGTDSRWNAAGTANFQSSSFAPPGGRLTVTTATPVITANTTAQTTVYYTPYLNSYIYLYDGSVWTLNSFSEMSQTLADNTKSPAATTADNNYDMFVWNDSGTLRCTRGPAWTSGTARGVGAGTTELVRVNGVWMNNVSITNGPAASRGVYVGTIRTGIGGGATGTNSVYFQPVTISAAGGGAHMLGIWNYYNRVEVAAISQDSTDSWAYTTKTWRAANAAGTGSGLFNRITFIVGINEDSIRAQYVAPNGNSTINPTFAGIGLDSITAFSGSPGVMDSNNAAGGGCPTGSFTGLPGLGIHYVQALEASTAAGATTWYGDNAADTFIQQALSFLWRM